MPENNTLEFNDLDLEMGQVLQIHLNPEVTERFDCKLIGCLIKEAVIITVPDSGEFPILEDGQKVSIRVSLASGVAVFPTTVLFISDMPAFMVYLDFPKAIRFKQVRQAPRVEVNLPVLVSNKQDPGIKGLVAQILDISLSGARLDSSESLGDVGSDVEIKGKFKVASVQRVVNIGAVIRSRTKTPDGHFLYGLQFAEIEDDDKLIFMFGYIFSELAFGHVQHVE